MILVPLGPGPGTSGEDSDDVRLVSHSVVFLVILITYKTDFLILVQTLCVLAPLCPGLNSKVSADPPLSPAAGPDCYFQPGQSATIITENINILKDKYVSIKPINHSLVVTDTVLS